MSKPLITILGKTIKHLAGLRGGGSALPGLVVEKIDPNFIKHNLSKLPMGVVVISGTNGKTTTTKMVVELLEGQGLKVFSNKTGSNFTRGIAAALLGDVDIKGNLSADIAVLELDEAHAVQFVNKISPDYSLILNVMRDQLDRFGEIDYTANLLKKVAEKTKQKVILNREDTRVAAIAESINKNKVSFFGLSDSLSSFFPNDNDFHKKIDKEQNKIKAEVILSEFSGDRASFIINNKKIETELKLNGIYNIFNAAAAISLVKQILKENLDYNKLTTSLSNVKPAFGRGELIMINGQPLELVLVKNPSGFRLGLESFDPTTYATMIAINDNYADGRDMSWLWDVDFMSLKEKGVFAVSGVRAYDMALRLQYDEVPVVDVDTDLRKSLSNFINNNKNTPKRIYCTYTAMTSLRKILSKVAKVEMIK